MYLVLKYAGGGDLYKKLRSAPGRRCVPLVSEACRASVTVALTQLVWPARFNERDAMLYIAQLVRCDSPQLDSADLVGW